MTRRALAMGLLVLGPTFAGCTSGAPQAPPLAAPPASEAAPAPPPTSALPYEGLSADAPPPTAGPAGGDASPFLAALAGIDAGLVANEERALRRADDICSKIEQGEDNAALVALAEMRCEGDSVPDLTAQQAAGIVSAARQFYC